MNAPLNPKHELFSQHVAAGLSATAAYRAVNGAVKNADVFGPRLMGNDRVRARIAELQAASATATTLTMQERRELLAKRARAEGVKDCDLVAIVMSDARLAGELEGDAATINTTVAVGVVTPERLQYLAELKREAIERVKRAQEALSLSDAPGGR